MDEHANGAHRGMTLQMEHTPCKDPMTDEAAVVSEFDFILLYPINCMATFLCKSLPNMQFQ